MTPSLDENVANEVIILADVSGSMRGDGKIQALNFAVRECVAHITALPGQTTVRILGFASEIEHEQLAKPGPGRLIEPLRVAGAGLTETGAAIGKALDAMGTGPQRRALLLFADGGPTDQTRPTFHEALARLNERPDISRVGVEVGRPGNVEDLAAFAGGPHAVAHDALHAVSILRLAWRSQENLAS